MNYTMLYEAWKKEKESPGIQHLDKHFFIDIGEYIKELNVEIELLDGKTLLAHIALEKQKNLEKIVTDLIQIRYTKISTALVKNQQIPSNNLTLEEDLIYSHLSSTVSNLKSMRRQILKGQAPTIKGIPKREESKVLLVRFLSDMPAIVSSNMKIYGPFKAEDIASLPTENAESLINRGVAVKVDMQ
jgi:DNA replication factor GINS